MFYQIPEILLCHEFFLQQLQGRVNEWHDKQKIGDIFVSSVRHCQNKPLVSVHSKLWRQLSVHETSTSVTHSAIILCATFLSLLHFHIICFLLMDSYWQHGIYLLSNFFVMEHLTFSLFLFLVYQVFSGGCLQRIHKSFSASQSCCKGSHSNQACFCAIHGGTVKKHFSCFIVQLPNYFCIIP